jgi:hypothetical protein
MVASPPQLAYGGLSDSLPFVSPSAEASPGGTAGLGVNFSFSDSFDNSHSLDG